MQGVHARWSRETLCAVSSTTVVVARFIASALSLRRTSTERTSAPLRTLAALSNAVLKAVSVRGRCWSAASVRRAWLCVSLAAQTPLGRVRCSSRAA